MSERIGTCSICSGACDYQKKLENDIKQYSVESDFQKATKTLPTAAVLNITDKCNNRCPYCFVCFNNNDMPYEIAERTVYFLMENCEKNNLGEKPSIAFFGGEPLLRFEDIIKPLMEKFGDQCEWSITTNGTLLTEEIIDFFSNYNIGFLLSWDGIKEVQDYQRPLVNGESSYDAIMKNIHYLVLKIPSLMCRATITKKSIPHIYETMVFWEKLGVKKCAFCINEKEVYEETDFEILRKEFEKCGFHIYKKLLKGDFPIQFTPLIQMFQTISEGDMSPVFHNELTRCGMGTTSIGVSFDGTLNPCQEENTSKKYSIGDIFSGIDMLKRDKYMQEYFNYMKDLTCSKFCLPSMRYTCFNSLCPNSIINEKGKITEGKCLYNRALFQTASRLFQNCRMSIFPNIREYFGGN